VSCTSWNPQERLKITSGFFAAKGAWTMLAAIAHNLLRAASTLIDTRHAVARGATLRRRLVNVPARVARPQGRPILHLPGHWPHTDAWKALWDNTFIDPPRQVAA